jgi:hypothetical protein
VPPA